MLISLKIEWQPIKFLTLTFLPWFSKQIKKKTDFSELSSWVEMVKMNSLKASMAACELKNKSARIPYNSCLLQTTTQPCELMWSLRSFVIAANRCIFCIFKKWALFNVNNTLSPFCGGFIYSPARGALCWILSQQCHTCFYSKLFGEHDHVSFVLNTIFWFTQTVSQNCPIVPASLLLYIPNEDH